MNDLRLTCTKKSKERERVRERDRERVREREREGENRMQLRDRKRFIVKRGQRGSMRQDIKERFRWTEKIESQ